MKRLVFVSLIIIMLLYFVKDIHADFRLQDWQVYSSMLNVQNVSFDSKGRLWTATKGGVFTYEPSSGAYKEYTNINGLMSLNISIVKCNPSRKTIFIGTLDGYLDIVTEEGQWTHITDIVSQKFTTPQIKDILFRDTVAYICGGFGLALFNQNNNVFIESVNKLGTFQPNTNVNQIAIIGNDIWVGTDIGIAKASLNSPLSVPQVWQNYTTTDGLTEQPVYAVINYHDTLYAASQHFIYKFVDNSFIHVDSVQSWDNILKLDIMNDKLLIGSLTAIREAGGNPINVTHPTTINSFSVYDSLIAVCYTEGLGFIVQDSLKRYIPNTPFTNQFLCLSVAPGGALWCATQGSGIMKLDSSSWTNFNSNTYPELNNEYFKIFAASDNRVIASNWGTGFTIITNTSTGYQFQNYNTTNSPMKGIASTPSYVIAADCREDPNGLLWIVNYGETSPGPVLVSINKQGNFQSYENSLGSSLRGFEQLAIDNYGTKWLGSSTTPPVAGLYYFNDVDNISGLFTVSNSAIADNSQTSLAVDNYGVLWIGTVSGLSEMLNPSAVLQGNKPIIRTVSLLSSEAINSIMVDALNNKWIATNDGVYVLNPDGDQVLTIINTQNSPLLTNEVDAITSDQNTGRIYFGTRAGLYSANSLAVKPLQSYNIKCYPQPYDPVKDAELIIDGLAQDTEFRILSIDGSLVKTIAVTGRKASWDGRNNSGGLVPSGVYIIVASSGSIDAASVGKIAVIRH